MLQVYRGYSYAANYFVSTLNINAPPSMQVGDIMVFVTCGDSMSRGFDTPYGWLLWDDKAPLYGTVRYQMFLKEANINDIQSGVVYGFGTDHFSMAGLMYAIGGAAFAVDQYSYQISDSYVNGGIVKAAPVTTTAPNEMLIWTAVFTTNNNPDVRTPSALWAHAYNLSGGGKAGAPCLSTGITASPFYGGAKGGYTDTTFTDAPIYVAHVQPGISLITFKSRQSSSEILKPLLYSEGF